jgi:hypothetical protein
MKAVNTIQKYFRGWKGRLLAHELRTERIARLREGVIASLGTVMGNPLDFCRVLVRRCVCV